MEIVKTQSNTFLGRKPLEYYENKIMKLKKGSMWTKDYRINFPVGDEAVFDDFFKISNKKYRVYKFTVCKRVENEYVCGLKFFYKNIENNSDVVEGFIMGPSDVFVNEKYKFQTFELKDYEYITELFGKKGMILDNFSVRTNLGKTYGFGGKGGGDYSLKAPEGFYFTCFGGLFSPSWDSISSFSVEVKEMPQDDGENQRREHSYHLKTYKPAFRKLVDFLTISEVTKLFRLNRDFARFRHDEYILTRIGCRCIYSGIPKLIKYIKKVSKYNPEDEPSTSSDQIHSYLNLSTNFNTNPDGFYDFQEYKIVENGGNQIQVQKTDKEANFITSYAFSTLLWEKTFEELFSDSKKFNCKEVIHKIQTSQYAIAAGASIAETGFGGEAKLKLEIYDNQGQILYSTNKNIKDLTREYQYYSLKYIHAWPDKVPHSIKFYISGKDTCFWAGHYGAKFKTITMKILPIESVQEKILFEQYVN